MVLVLLINNIHNIQTRYENNKIRFNLQIVCANSVAVTNSVANSVNDSVSVTSSVANSL